MTSSFGNAEDVRALSDEELKEREKEMVRNREPARLLLLRQGTVSPENTFERKYVEVCNELQRRGLLDVQ